MMQEILIGTIVTLFLVTMSVILLPRTKKEWHSFFGFYLIIFILTIVISSLAGPIAKTALVLFWIPTFVLGFALATLLTATFRKEQRKTNKEEKEDVAASKIGLAIWFTVFLISVTILKFGLYSSRNIFYLN